MATTIRELLVRLGVDADTKKVAEFDRALATTKGTMVKIAGVAVLAAGALTAFAVSTANAGDEAAKAAARVGLDVEAMQELGFAAQLAGADMTSIEVAFRRQAVAARDAEKSALSPSALAYKAIGVSVRDASGAMKGQLQLFEESAEGLRGLKTDTERMAIANDLFGRGGAKILPLLNQGAEGIRKAREQARELGFVMSKEATVASEEFIDALTETKAVLVGVRNQIGIALIPIFTRFVDRLRGWFLANKVVIKQRIDKVIDGITTAVDFLDEAFERLNKRVQGVGGWGVIFDQVRKVVTSMVVAFGIAKLIRAIGVVHALVVGAGAVASALGGPVVVALGLAVAALLSFLLIGEDFLTFMRGGESVIGSFLAAFGLKEETRAALLDELKQLQRVGLALWEIFKLIVAVFGPTNAEIEAMKDGAKALAAVLKSGLQVVLEALVGNITGATRDIDALATALENPKSVLVGIIETIDTLLGKVAELGDTNLGKMIRFSPGGLLAGAGGALSKSVLGGIAARGRAGLANIGPTPAAATAGGGGSSTTNTTTVGGNTITINAPNADAKQVAAEVAKQDASARRKAFAAAQGGER